MKFTNLLITILTLTQLLFAARPAVYGENGVVVAHDLEACEAGIEILKAGGNAVDAAVAVTYALAVTHPQAGNLGGGGFMLIQMADGRRAAIDYREMAPSGAHRDMFLDDSGHVSESLSRKGGLANGVPGTVAGVQLALDSFGTMKRQKVIKPAIKLAKRGFEIPYSLASSLAWLIRSTRKYPETQEAFSKNGEQYRPGERFKQPDLAKTLKLIKRKGNRGFYQGAVAEALVKTNNKYGGIITLEDLANYKAIIREPAVGTYRGHEVLSMPPPSSGGIALISMLNMMEHADFDSIPWHSTDHIHLLAEIQKRAYADRSIWLGDPDFFDVPTQDLLSKAYAEVRMEGFLDSIATPSDSINPLNDSTLRGIGLGFKESEETTHFSVVDKWGNAVSVTTTLNFSFGSFVTVDGYGFLLNNEMDDFSAKAGVPNAFGLLGADANAIEPGKRMLSSMTPTIINRDGQPMLLVGAPGGSTIITTVLQVINNVVDYDLSLQEAVNAPRFHHQWRPDTLYHAFGSIAPETQLELKQMGYTLEKRGKYGEVNAIIRDRRFGGWIGAPDYRLASHALAY